MLKWTLTALALIACQLAFAVEGSAVRHTLSFPEKNNQYVHVNSKFPVASEQLELSLPSWTPGSYLIRDFATNLERMQATDSAGQQLGITKIAKNRWRLDTRGVTELTLDYDIWAGRMNVAESWVESDFAMLNGAGIFLYNEQMRLLPHSVRVDLPGSWPRFIPRWRNQEVSSCFWPGITTNCLTARLSRVTPLNMTSK